MIDLNYVGDSLTAICGEDMIDRFELTDYGAKYRYDGLLWCHIIIDGPDHIIDVGDTLTPLEHKHLGTRSTVEEYLERVRGESGLQ